MRKYFRSLLCVFIASLWTLPTRAQPQHIDGTNDVEIIASWEKFFRTHFDEDRLKRASVDLVISPDASKYLTIDEKRIEKLCDSNEEGKRLDDANLIEVEFQNEDNVIFFLSFKLSSAEEVRAWTDVSCIYTGQVEKSLRIRGSFTAKSFIQTVQMIDLRFTSVKPF
jgi:hypothetical protein